MFFGYVFKGDRFMILHRSTSTRGRGLSSTLLFMLLVMNYGGLVKYSSPAIRASHLSASSLAVLRAQAAILKRLSSFRRFWTTLGSV